MALLTGNEDAAESDGEAMVNAAETLLELGAPFVVLTLWQDNSLARSVATGKATGNRKQEKEAGLANCTMIISHGYGDHCVLERAQREH
jgi:hypothetical protein